MLNKYLVRKNEDGQTLLELIVVISVSIIVIGALVFTTIASLRNAQFSKNQAQATKLAQEGIERVRTGRDRDSSISITGVLTVDSWNGNASGDGSIWDYEIYARCGSGDGIACYFNVNNSGSLQYLTSATDIPSDAAEDPLEDGKFKRVIILSDDSTTYGSQKKVTVIVRWNDFSGPHESRLTTILRKI